MLSINTAVEMFLLEQKTRNNSDETIAYYTVSLDKFKSFVDASDFIDCAHDVSVLDINLYKQYSLYLLNVPTLQSTSVHTYLRAVKAFYNWLINEEYIEDISRKLKLTKQFKKQIIPLSDGEVVHLLRHFNEYTFLGLRNKCICILMLDCGLRRGEIVKLKICDLLFERDLILINGKGSKQRLVPFGSKSKLLLKMYIEIYRSGALANESLFISYYNASPITSNTIRCLFDELKKQTGIYRLYPHLLRHTFATNYILDGGDLETLRLILGHSTINITQIYLHLANSYKLAYARHNSHLDRLGE